MSSITDLEIFTVKIVHVRKGIIFKDRKDSTEKTLIRAIYVIEYFNF
jgi:hypothetical protein